MHDKKATTPQSTVRLDARDLKPTHSPRVRTAVRAGEALVVKQKVTE